MRFNAIILLLSFLLLQNCKNAEEGKYLPLFVLSADSLRLGPDIWTWTEDGITASGDSVYSYIFTDEEFLNFELSLEFFPDSLVNSGIFIRCSDEPSAQDCLEINIWDLHPRQEFRTGALVLKSSPKQNLNSINKWNKYQIKAKGEEVKVWLNDVLVIDYLDSVPRSAPIFLQWAEGGTIKFRNIKIKALSSK